MKHLTKLLFIFLVVVAIGCDDEVVDIELLQPADQPENVLSKDSPKSTTLKSGGDSQDDPQPSGGVN